MNINQIEKKRKEKPSNRYDDVRNIIIVKFVYVKFVVVKVKKAIDTSESRYLENSRSFSFLEKLKYPKKSHFL